MKEGGRGLGFPVKQAGDEEDVEHQQHLQWLQSTEYLVVISEAQNEVKTFKDWGLDIIPHRQIIKSRNLEEEFKNEKHPFRLAIVCAMWLTGFDVPSLATLYIDKPLQGHTLIKRSLVKTGSTKAKIMAC